jgi:hypothetical protein
MTEIVVVERELTEPADIHELQAREDSVGWCLEQHGVTAVCSYVALDRRTAICVYRAPDADALRETQRRAGLPVTRAWTAEIMGTLVPTSALDMATIIVQRELPSPITRDVLEQLLAREGHCLALHRAELLVSHLACGGSRMLCVFTAPDAESVRIANRQVGMPVTRAWPATIHVAPRR